VASPKRTDMSKPRWIDGGVFRTLRTATRKRTLSVILGPAHGTADLSTRAALREALGDGDRASLAEDPRCKSGPDGGLAAAWMLRQPGLITSSVSDAVEAVAPDDLEAPPRVFGPNGKGLVSAYGRKDPFVVHLAGCAAQPDTLVLTAKDRKTLMAQDSRYQSFLRTTFGRTVLFSGFQLDDPDLMGLLDDVGRVFNGHVPPNIALIPEGSADPAAALRASMHYGTTVVEFPASMTPSSALEELAKLLEELEVPKPATGDPPRGYTELHDDFRASVAACDDDELQRFAAGYGRSWSPIKDGLDAPRTAAATVTDALASEAPEDRISMVLVKGRGGEGKTTFLRRLAWDLGGSGPRVFWREPGVAAPDRYVPAEADNAKAVFVMDDADQLDGLPLLLQQLAREGAGKVRLVLGADADRWDRSGLDHRVRQHAVVSEVPFEGLDADEASTLAARLSDQGRLTSGLDKDGAAATLSEADQTVLDGVSRATRGQSVDEACAAFVSGLGGQELVSKALLGTAFVHRFGMSIARDHLAALLGIGADDLQSKVIDPGAPMLVPAGEGAVRTPHPVVAASLVTALASEEADQHAMTLEMLRSLPGVPTEHQTVFHAPSELIRALRAGPLPPLTLASFFEAGEHAARTDVLFWFDRGRAEADFQRWDSALAAFDQALWRRAEETREKEHNAVVHANRARCLAALGKKREALSAAEEGLRASPRDAGLLRLHEKLGGRRSGGGPRGRGGRDGGGGGRGRGGPGGGRGGPGGGRGGPGGGRGGPGGGRGGPGGGGGGGGGPRTAAGAGRQGPRRPGDAPGS
jgi:hypothetical protein